MAIHWIVHLLNLNQMQLSSRVEMGNSTDPLKRGITSTWGFSGLLGGNAFYAGRFYHTGPSRCALKTRLLVWLAPWEERGNAGGSSEARRVAAP